MKEFFNNLSIKNKILLTGLLIVILSVVPPLILASFNGLSALQNIAIKESIYVNNVLEIILNHQKENLIQGTEFITKRNIPRQAMEKGDYAILNNESLPKAKNKVTDVLIIVNKQGNIIADLNNPSRTGKLSSFSGIINQSLNENRLISSYEVFSKADLLNEKYSLYEKVKMEKIVTKDSKPGFKEKVLEEDALMQVVVNPIQSMDKSRVIGAVIAGKILNRDEEIVDEVKAKNEGIAITIFKDDLRVATNVKKDNGDRATGTRLSEKVVDKVLIKGEDYSGKALVLGKGYWAYYIPIKNANNEVIGAFFTAMSEEFLNKTIYEVLGINVIISFLILITFIMYLLMFIAKKISEPITDLTNASLKLAENDFTVKIPDNENADEIGALSRAFKKLSKNLSRLISDISTTAKEVAANVDEMSIATDQTAEGAQQIATSVSQLAQGTQQITSGVTQLAAGAQDQAKLVHDSLNNISSINKTIHFISVGSEDTIQISKNSENDAADGCKQASKAVDKVNQLKVSTVEVSETINELGELSSDIEMIVDLIKNIAHQTNLLALNAAIEAARAGNQGKGFAVVAEEVKKLAGQSADATDKITAMIKQIQNKTKDAVSSMNKNVQEVDEGVVIIEDVGHSLEQILNAARETTLQIQEIAREVKSLSNNSNEVVKMVENIAMISEQSAESADQIASITEQSSASAEEISSITEEQTASLQQVSASNHTLAETAEHLKKQISIFKI